MTVKELVSKFFKLVAFILGVAAAAALVWQIYFVFSTGRWEWLTFASAISLDAMTMVTGGFYSTLLVSLIYHFPLFLGTALLAQFFNFIGNKLD
jgi:hypothetical protein